MHTDVASKVSPFYIMSTEHKKGRDGTWPLLTGKEQLLGYLRAQRRWRVIGDSRSLSEATNPFPFPFNTDFYLFYPYFHPLQVYCPLCPLCVTRFTLNLQALGLACGSGNRQIPVSLRPSWLCKKFQNSQDCIVTLCLRNKQTNKQ